MSYTYLLDAGAESSAECFSDIPASVLSRLNLTEGSHYCSGSVKESCHDSQFGTTSEPSMVSHGQRRSILSRRASRVTTSHRRAKRLASMEKSLPCSLKFAESPLRFDRVTYSWRTVGTLWEE